MRSRLQRIGLVVVIALMLVLALSSTAQALSSEEQLGKALFFDTDLSTPPGMSCATCHDPLAAFADPRTGFPVSQGIVPVFFGNRNSPTAAYAAFSPPFHYCSCGSGMGGECTCGGMGGGGCTCGGGMGGDCTCGGGGMGGGMGGGGMTPGYVGGQFWDGRAATLEEQAKGPFLNPLEMHNPNKKMVVLNVRRADYADLFRSVYGADSLVDVEMAYDYVASAIAAYERTTEVSPFTSKFDYHRANPMAVPLSQMERMGMMVYNVKAKCSTCHPLMTGGGGMGGGGGGMGGGGGGMGGGGGGGGGGMMGKALFTDFRYKNLGTPANPLNPYYDLPTAFNPLGEDYVDVGLGDTLRAQGVSEERAALEDGKIKTPTLRNVAVTAPYMHNGVFSNLMQVVHFYNTGEVLLGMDADGKPIDEAWPAEVAANIEPGFVGNLGLTPQEGMALIAFLNTLTDGYQPSTQ